MKFTGAMKAIRIEWLRTFSCFRNKRSTWRERTQTGWAF